MYKFSTNSKQAERRRVVSYLSWKATYHLPTTYIHVLYFFFKRRIIISISIKDETLAAIGCVIILSVRCMHACMHDERTLPVHTYTGLRVVHLRRGQEWFGSLATMNY